jgi:hypothetical protein
MASDKRDKEWQREASVLVESGDPNVLSFQLHVNPWQVLRVGDEVGAPAAALVILADSSPSQQIAIWLAVGSSQKRREG